MARFAKGNPGGGRPKGSRNKAKIISDEIRAYLAANKYEKAKRLAKTCVELACAGDPKFAKLVLEYVEGAPAQAVDITSNGDPIKTLINVNIDDV